MASRHFAAEQADAAAADDCETDALRRCPHCSLSFVIPGRRVAANPESVSIY
jgi:hypothetical protein